jgi:uncharacterized OsmC-like protein
MLKKQLTQAEVHVEMDWFVTGSVLANTIEAGASACRTHFKVDSPESREDIERIIRLAKRGCFAEQMVRTAVPLTSTFEVNGVAADIALD